MAKIIIKRKSTFIASLVKHDVYLMNTYIGELKNGGVMIIPAGVGTHRLFFKEKRKNYTTIFDVVVNYDSEVVKLKTRYSVDGYLVEYADNAPHIPTYGNSMTTDFKQNTSYNSFEFAGSQTQNFNKKRKKTVTCRTCGADISPRAQKCPHCGGKPLSTEFGEALVAIVYTIIFLPFICVILAIAFVFYMALFSH